MLVLICVLAVLLVVSIVIALSMNGGPGTNPGETEQTGPSTTAPTQTLPTGTAPRDVILSAEPADAVSAKSGDILRMEVTALEGSAVTARVGGKTVTMRQARSAAQEGYAVYTGAYAFVGDLPRDMGKIDFLVSYEGVTVTRTSGPVSYQQVENGKYVAEVINFNAETFDGNTTDDYSHPTNSYLPQGTVDYCDPTPVSANNLKYIKWRFGMRTYVQKKNIPSSVKTEVTTQYPGVLPDHNEMGAASLTVEGHHTVLTLDTLWKAPFRLKLLPQEYRNPNGGSNRSYLITGCTVEYVQIELCYTTAFSGEIELGNNPLFRSAEVIQNDNSCTLRLYLKTVGGFYGWDSYYNDNDQLCFRFLNPVSASAASNSYGADLSGITVYLDVGHGGVDGGAVGVDENGDRWNESGRNMDLAKAVQKELESMGTTVILNRDGKVTINVNDRNKGLHDAAPDLCIAFHHNSIGGYPNINGFECYYFDLFSAAPANLILKRTSASGVYKYAAVNWHTYFVCRETVCPVVLTENGYMTNLDELHGTLDSAIIAKKARAIAQGTADYFLSIT